MKIDLKDVTFTIPVRIDTAERIRNIITSIKYLLTYFDTNIIVGEESDHPYMRQELINADVFENIQYIHVQTSNPMFHRTKMLNIMAKMSSTSVIVNYDADVILPIHAYVESYRLISHETAHMVFPYNGRFIDISGDTLNQFLNTLNPSVFAENKGVLIHPSSVGGAIFWNKKVFNSIGMENEKFISWGFEDNSRVATATIMGLKIYRTPNPLFHMNHPASTNSANTAHPQYFLNQQEYQKVASMNKHQLSEYIKTFTWVTQ